jgi:hypothetical protein
MIDRLMQNKRARTYHTCQCGLYVHQQRPGSHLGWIWAKAVSAAVLTGRLMHTAHPHPQRTLMLARVLQPEQRPL